MKTPKHGDVLSYKEGRSKTELDDYEKYRLLTFGRVFIDGKEYKETDDLFEVKLGKGGYLKFYDRVDGVLVIEGGTAATKTLAGNVEIREPDKIHKK